MYLVKSTAECYYCKNKKMHRFILYNDISICYRCIDCGVFIPTKFEYFKYNDHIYKFL